MIKIYPRPNEQLQSAMRRLQKICEREGVIREMKKHSFYEKPSEQRRRQKRKAIKRERQILEEQNPNPTQSKKQPRR